MFIAEEKYQTNIAEYLIYMFQIEDMLRVFNFDLERVRNEYVRPQVKSEAFENKAVDWYKDIIDEMKSRHLESKGHLYRVGEVLTELIYLHNTLLDVVKDGKYQTLLDTASENIEDFRKKSGMETAHLMEVCLHAMYMKLLLKMKGEEISEATETAFDSMRIILAYISKAYHQMKKGDMTMFEKKD